MAVGSMLLNLFTARISLIALCTVFFRPSKAKRSYDHAELYLKIGVGTPQPVGYFNVRSGLLFDKSYYVSCLSTCPYVYNDLFRRKFDYEEEVLREIGRVTAVLHEHGICP